MNETILQIIRDFSLSNYEPIFPRSLDLGDPLIPKAGNLVKTVVGMRRSGKSYRLFQEMKTLLDAGIDASRVMYFSFEDDRLDPVTSKTGDEVIDAFRQLNPDAFEQGVYLFFDEIQEMDGWDKWLRRIVDSTKATIYITGSSSKLLIEDVATAFRGRSVAFELLPFSFEEFCRYCEGDIVDLDFSNTTSIEDAKLRNLCIEYLKRGGFPATQNQPLPIAFQSLQSYAQWVTSKDILERHNISQARGVSIFAQRLLSMTARSVSLRKIENSLRSQGIKVIRSALSKWMSYFQDAYMIAIVRERSRALSENTTSMPKVYAIDPGLAAANSPAATDDEGHRLETAVYLELRRRNSSIRKEGIASYKTATGKEVDFCVGDVLEDSDLSFFQVAFSVEDEATLNRELSSLEEAMAERKVSESFLITMDGESRDVGISSGTVHIVPAWHWLLGHSRLSIMGSNK